MQIETYDRKPFTVKAVQVDFKNFEEVAKWCKGTVTTQKAKLMGVDTEVPAVRVEGQGENRGKSFVAGIGCYVVELKGSFRVYKPAQFESSFEKAKDQEAQPTPVEAMLADNPGYEHLIEDMDIEHVIKDPQPYFAAKDDFGN